MLNMHVQGKRRRGGYHQEDVKHASAGKEKKGRIPPRRCQTCKWREREEGEDTTKKMLNMQVQGKRRRGGYHQEDVKHASAGKEKKGRIPPRRCQTCKWREREEGEDTTKKMLNMQVQGKRRRGGYHQEDVKHASAGKEKKGRIPPRRC